MLTLNHISYLHQNGDLLLDNINLSINKLDKVALVGNNGSGKSTLLKIMAGYLSPSAGEITTGLKVYYVPQHFGQFNNLTVAMALQIDARLQALKEIINGNATEKNITLLNDDWLLEERCVEALSSWELESLDLNRKMETLSGGQKTKVFLAGIEIHKPEIILLDEPSNHLDVRGRDNLYNYINKTKDTLVVVSHDRTLLSLLDVVYELSKQGITIYGGDYTFYAEQKKAERDALNQNLRLQEKALRKAKEVERETLERKQKLDARGKKKQEKAGLPTIVLNTLRNNAQKSSSRLKEVHTEKIESISQTLSQARQALLEIDRIKINLDNGKLHHGKNLIVARDINYGYSEPLWRNPVNLTITSGARVVIKGGNGAGKTTLIRMMLGEIKPQSGVIERTEIKSIYIDQDYSMIDSTLTVFEQTQRFNYDKLPEHELKIRLNRFLFTKESWRLPCFLLSGGEKMRLTLCCLMISNHAPDLIVLDEPTNNLDIQNTDILTTAIRQYEGTLIVVSHDKYFLEQVGVDQEIILPPEL